MKTTNDYTINELLGKKVQSKANENIIGLIVKINPWPEDRYDSFDVEWSNGNKSIGCFHGFINTYLEVVI